MTDQNEKKLNVKSFELDHRLVSAPYIRVADRTDLGGGVEIIKYDLRFCQPNQDHLDTCLLYTSPSPRDATLSRMPSSA